MQVSYVTGFLSDEERLVEKLRLLRSALLRSPVHEVSEVTSSADADCDMELACRQVFECLLEYHHIYALPPEHANHIREYLEPHFKGFVLRVQATADVKCWLWVSFGHIGESSCWSGKIWCDTEGVRLDDMPESMQELWRRLFAACVDLELIDDRETAHS